MRYVPALLFPLALLLAGCRAGPEINVTGAYAYVEQDSNDTLLDPIVDSKGGGRFSVGVQVPVGGSADGYDGNGFQVGGRFAASYYRQDIGERRVGGEPLLTVQDYSDLSIFAPMATVSYRAVVGDPYDGGFFVEPGVGVGFAVGYTSFGSELQFDDDPLAYNNGNDDDTDVSYAVNPFLRLGYANERFAFGGEGGYQWTGLDFGRGLGQDAREWYVGLFFGVRVGQ